MPVTPAPMPALVMAGYDMAHSGIPHQRNGDEVIAGHKALLQVAGKPLVAYTIDALRESPRIGAITVVGVDRSQVDLGADITCLPNQRSLVDNGLFALRSIMDSAQQPPLVLVTGSDAPLLTAEAVTWFVDGCAPWSAGLYMAVASKATVERRFPGSRRTYLRTRDGRFCSADLFLVRPDAILQQDALLRDLLARRKHPLSQVRLLGVGWLLRVLLGRAGLDDLPQAADRLLRLDMRAVPLPFAGAAMDVDKPFQLEIVRSALEGRTSRP